MTVRQDFGPRPPLVRLRTRALRRLLFPKRSRLRSRFPRQRVIEGAALALGAGHPDPSAVLFDDGLGQGQSRPGPLDRIVGVLDGGAAPEELLQDPRNLVAGGPPPL